MTGIVRYPSPTSAVSDLNDLTDVVITDPAEFQVLKYNGTEWVNAHSSSSVYVRNAESTTLTTGTVVYLFGATGDHATVKRADNDSDTTSSKTVGVVSAPIAASENGVVITQGYVDGIDLSTGYTAGDVLWLGDDGNFTTTKPSAPDHLVFVGVVVRANSNGIIYVSTQNGYELDELHNVALSNPTSGDFLKFNGSLWVNDPINLGTDTTGDYVASLVAGTGISLANNSGEGATPTISSVAARVSDGPPSSPVAGQLWFESDTGRTFVYYDSFWVETTSIGATGPTGATGASGKVVQMVTATSTTAAGDSAGSWTDSNLSCSITPSSSSNKIMVMVTQSMYNYYNNTSTYVGMNIRLLRDSSTTLQTFLDAGFIRIGAGTGADTVFQFATNYVDSPNTTSSVTYKTQIARSLGGSTVYSQVNSNPGVMILMEVTP